MGKRNMDKRFLVVSVIALFIGVAVYPSTATVQQVEDTNEEPKGILFQTIIEISNHQEVRDLIEQYNQNLFTSNHIDAFPRLLLKESRLPFRIPFTKPSSSYEFLDKCYNSGIELINIFSEDKVLKIVETAELYNPEVLEEINSIVVEDEILSEKISLLREINTNPIWPNTPLICKILLIIILPLYILAAPAIAILEIYDQEPNSIGPILFHLAFIWAYLLYIFIEPLLYLFIYEFNCLD